MGWIGFVDAKAYRLLRSDNRQPLTGWQLVVCRSANDAGEGSKAAGEGLLAAEISADAGVKGITRHRQQDAAIYVVTNFPQTVSEWDRRIHSVFGDNAD